MTRRSSYILFLLFTLTAHAQVNDWINPGSGNWHDAASWSLGLPDPSQSAVRITNSNSKAVAIQPDTAANFPTSMTVQDLVVGGVAPDTNLLLLNYSGPATPLRVLHNLTIEANGRLLMLHSGLNVSNLIKLHGVLDQQAGELTFTNSPASRMQIEGGHFNLTNAVVAGANMSLGGTNDGFVTQGSGLVTLDWLMLGFKRPFGSHSKGTYTLESGWLIVGVHQAVGYHGAGALIQNGGTNSAGEIALIDGHYLKNAGGLFAGEVRVMAPSELLTAGTMTHAGGTAIITNRLRLLASESNTRPAKFNMLDGSLSTRRIELNRAGVFTQSNGTVNVSEELFLEEGRPGHWPPNYYLFGGNVLSARSTISSYSGYSTAASFDQAGGIHVVTNSLLLNGNAVYRLTAGTLAAPTIYMTGNFGDPPQLFVSGAPPYTITNQTIHLASGAVVIMDSAQQLGRLTLQTPSGVKLDGSSAILRFADSHTNDWSGFGTPPPLVVYNWNGFTNGGGPDQLSFGTDNSGLTATQLSQVRFVDPAGFQPGTYPSRMLPTGEVVPMPQPLLTFQNNPTNVVLNWSGDFILQSATNIAGPYFDVTNVGPYQLDIRQFPMEFFRLRR